MQTAGALSPGKIVVLVVVVLLLFGGKRLRSFGSDLGEAIKKTKIINSLESILSYFYKIKIRQ